MGRGGGYGIYLYVYGKNTKKRKEKALKKGGVVLVKEVSGKWQTTGKGRGRRRVK